MIATLHFTLERRALKSVKINCTTCSDFQAMRLNDHNSGGDCVAGSASVVAMSDDEAHSSCGM